MLFERESRREKILEARQRELKLKERERSGKARVDDDAPKRKISKNISTNSLIIAIEK